jgi:hypothetical protein
MGWDGMGWGSYVDAGKEFDQGVGEGLDHGVGLGEVGAGWVLGGEIDVGLVWF